MVHLLIHHNRSAHTGAVGQTDKIPLSPSCAEDSFTQCGCIYIIFYGYRHMKTLSQHAADLHSRITGNVFIGIAYHSSLGIYLSGGADPNGIKTMIAFQNLYSLFHYMGTSKPGIGRSLPYFFYFVLYSRPYP